jgi:hypothetical protein
VTILDVTGLEAVQDAGVPAIVEDTVVERLDMHGRAARMFTDRLPVDVATEFAGGDHDVGES